MPNNHEIVFKLTAPDGQIVAEALQLPLSAPVPKEYAEKFDRRKPSDYADYQVATGPYMLKNDAAGKVLGIGYIPGRSATRVRNPNWRRATDFRPAYVNARRIKIGGTSAVLGRQVLEVTMLIRARQWASTYTTSTWPPSRICRYQHHPLALPVVRLPYRAQDA
jgi:peptide/nickel transport system substrate-binding protein